MLVLDVLGRPVLVNAAARQLLGPGLSLSRSVEEQAVDFSALEPAGDEPVPVGDLLARVLQGETIRAYEMTLRPPGEDRQVWVQVSAAPLRRPGGSISGVGVVIVDVSHERQLARQVAAHARENLYLHGVLAERERRLQDLLEHLLQPQRRPPRLPTHQTDLGRLTPRERDVLRLLGDGLSNAEIARELHLAIGTVRLHLKHILAKLGFASRTQAALRAYEHWHR
jgi:DNA-binding CsgD family transcriptional regulator